MAMAMAMAMATLTMRALLPSAKGNGEMMTDAEPVGTGGAPAPQR